MFSLFDKILIAQESINQAIEQRNNTTALVLLILLGIGVLAGSVGLLLNSSFKRKEDYEIGYQLALHQQIPEFIANKSRMKRIEKGWQDGLKFLLEKERKEASLQAKKKAFEQKLLNGELDGALSVIERKTP